MNGLPAIAINSVIERSKVILTCLYQYQSPANKYVTLSVAAQED